MRARLFLCAFCLLALVPAHAAERIASMAEVEKTIEKLAAAHGEESVLVVFDIDNTLLRMKQDLGSDAWWYWQTLMLEGSSPYLVAPDIAGLVDAQYLLYAASDMEPVEAVTPGLVKRLQDKKHPVFALTARGPAVYSPTVRELSAGGYDLNPTAPICAEPLCAVRGTTTADQLRRAAGEAGISLREDRIAPVIYSDGVLMVAGQNKGHMLKIFLASVKQPPPAAIVFVDDSEKNVKDIEAAYKDDPLMHVVHYTHLDQDVNDFRNNPARMQKAADEWEAIQAPVCKATSNFCPRKLRIASWNMENLYHVTGQDLPGRPGSARREEDYAHLQRYARMIDADVIALQEVNCIEAIRRVFPEQEWQAFIDGRRQEDIDKGRETDGIYTGFVVRNAIKVLGTKDLPELGVMHTEDGVSRPARWGLEIMLERAGKRLNLISVHLKSGCSNGVLDNDNNPDNRFENPLNAHCTTLATQIPILDRLIDEREAATEPFLIMGDFNRAIDVDGSRDILWKRIDDRQPEGARLSRYPFSRAAECWRGTFKYHYAPIDLVIADKRASELIVPRSQGWVTYDKALAERPHKVSDHCPVYVDLNW